MSEQEGVKFRLERSTHYESTVSDTSVFLGPTAVRGITVTFSQLDASSR
jgi:hypothetical protein